MSSGLSGGRSPTRGSANYSTRMGLDDNVPANVIVRAGKNLSESIDRTEEFLLPASEKRVVMKCDKNDPTTAVFTFNRDGQTLGGLLVSALLALPCVTFAAYRVPHPLFYVFELRLTTDGAMSPKEALLEASKNMVEDLVMLSRRFTHEWELLKQAEVTEGGGNSDFEMMSEHATYGRAVSSAEEAMNRGRSFRERSQQDTRYEFGFGSPERSGCLGYGSPASVGYQGEGQRRTGSEVGVKPLVAGLQASWASGQQAGRPNRRNHQGGVKAGSPPEDPYRASAAVPNRFVDQGFWGDEKLRHQKDSQTEGYQDYGSQGLGRSGYQFGDQQASTAQAEGDWTPEHQRINNQSPSHPDSKRGSGHRIGGQQATTTIQGGDWTPEYQRLAGQGSGYQNRLQSPNRADHQERANDQAGETHVMNPQTPGYQGWGQPLRRKEDTDAPNDATMQDNDW